MASNSSTGNSKQLLSAWGLPQPILEAFYRKGLKQLYPWQAAALECAAAGNNLVYTAPTSGGKSLVADVLMLSRLHKTQQALLAKAGPHKSRKPPPQQQPVTRALIVLPYLSIVSEKTAHLSKLLEAAKWRVMGYKGDDADGQPLVHPAERISICSIEKANGAINRMIQEGRLAELVSVTIDEAHMLADENRGAALEMLLSKLVASRGRCSVQIVAMSATMSGLDSLSTWLDAHLFLTNFRPVPLVEHAVFEGTVFAKTDRRQLAGADPEADSILEEQRTLEGAGKNDRESLVALVTEVAAEGHSVLVFCAGRAASQSCAEVLAKELPKRLGPPSADAAAARAELIGSLWIALSGSTDATFEKLLAAGVAYHHAGLTNQERSVVEQGFSSGALLVLTATSTLAAGVNLPARRVILRSLWQGVGDVSRAQYLQMVGRAGRAGHSAVGEAFLMARGSAHASSGEWGKVCKLLAAPLPVLQSQLVKQPPPAAAVHPKPPRSRAAAAAVPGSTQPPQQPQEHEDLTSSLLVESGTQSGGCSTLPQTCGSSASGRVGALSGGGVRRAVASGPPGATAGSQPSAQPEVDVAAQSRLQHLLLDAFATELATTGESVQQLLQSTLAFFHVPWDVLAAAAHAALSALRTRRLTTLLPNTPEKPSHWKLTPLGRAVVASTLDPGTGLKLYSRLESMRSCMVLGSHVQLLYVLQTSSVLSIFDWSVWSRFMKQLSPQQRRVAEVEGIDTSYIDRRIGGQPGNPISDEQHGRFAAAVLLDWLVADVNNMQLLEAAWGKPNSLTKAGISRGTLQKWQAEVSKTAAMAALLAAEAEWWQLDTLLAPLAAQVAAGVRPELLPLMKVPGMQPSHAAALNAAGLGHPDLLLCASEGEVAAALAAGLPANMRKRKKQKDKQGLAVSLTGNPGTNALVTRAARSVLAAARQHAVLAAASVVQGEDGGDEGEQATHLATQQQQQLLAPVRTKVLMGQATVHQVWPRKSDPLLARLLDAWQLQSSFALALILQEQHCAAAAAAAGGSSGDGSSGAAFQNCGTVSGQQEQQQPQGGAKGVGACAGMHGPVPSALVLCWSDKEAVVLHLPPVPTHSSSGGSAANASGGRRRSSRAAAAAAAGSAGSNATAVMAAATAAAAGDETAQWVWSVINGIMGDPCKTVTCAGAVQVLAALSAIGVSVSAVVDDPCAAFLLWQPQGLDHAAGAGAAGAAGAGGGGQQQPAEQEQQPWALAGRAAKAASAVVLGGAFKLQVPLLPGSTGAATTAAAKSALLARALMPPLRALLAKQQLSAAYESVEQPLLRAFAEVRSGGVCVSASSLQHQLQLCDWQTQVLQQRLALALMDTQQQQQQVQQQETQPFGAQAVASLSDSDIRVFLHQQRLFNLSHERLQQLPLLQLVQLAGRGAVKRHYTAILPLLRLLLTYCHSQQHQKQLQQLLRQFVVLPAPRCQEQQVDGSADTSSSSSSAAAGCVVLQPHPGLEPITGQVAAGWPAGLEGLLGLSSVPALPVLTSTTNLAEQGFKSLQGAVTVAAAVQTGTQNHHDQQQQQDGEMYVIGKLCSIKPVPAALEQAQSNSQLLPWQVPENPAATAAAGGAAGGSSTLLLQQQQQVGSSTCGGCTATARAGSVQLWCGVTESVRELQLPTAALYSVLRPPPQQQQQHWQQCDSSSGGGCLAFLPGTCSIIHLAAPSSSSNSFVGVQLQHLPLLVLAGLSQEDALVAAATQNAAPLAAAAAAWLPASGLPQQLQRVLLQNVQAGVLDGVPVPAGAAPGVLFSVAAAALVLGLKPSAQREQLGAGGDWLKGLDLADSLFCAFPGLLAWRERLLEDARSSRFLRTPLGRRLPFQLPPSGGANQTAAAAKALKEAQRSAVSLVLLSAIGDVQRLVVGCMQRACSAWQASASGCSGGASNGHCDDAGSGSGNGRGVRAQARSRQQAVGAVPAGSRSGKSSAGAGAAAGGAGSSGGDRAPGRLLPGCQGAPSGCAVDGAAGGSGAQAQSARFVAVSGSQVVVEVPAGWALPLLKCCARQVGREVTQLLGFPEAGEAEAAEGAAAGARLCLPFRWWWGGSLDVLQNNAFTA